MRLGVAFSVTTPSPPTVDEDLVIIGTTGSRPAAGSGYAGRQFYATDTGLVYVCVPDGGGYIWKTIGPSAGISELVAIDYTGASCTPGPDIAATGNGAYTIAGESWTAANMSHASALAVGASGITGKATSDASSFPVVHTTIAGLSGATVAERPVLVVMARVRRTTSGADADCGLALQLGLGAYTAADNQPQRYVLTLSRNGSGAYVGAGRASNLTAGGGFAYTTSVGDDMVLAFALTAAGRQCAVYVGTWGGSWPDLGDLTQMSVLAMVPDASASDAWTPADLTLVAQWSNTGNTANEFSLSGLRVLG